MFGVFIVEGKQNKFVVSGSPDSNNITSYKDHILKHDVTCVVRLCKPLYDEIVLKKLGVEIVDIYLDDGNIPDQKQLCEWIEITKTHKNIGIHCVAGLGRAPTMVCSALVINDKKNAYDAITDVRTIIKSSFNRRQIDFLTNIKRSTYTSKSRGCVIC
jgi:protein tyrosine phosphatase type 4A